MTADSAVSASAVDRMVRALANPQHLYTADQVAWLIQRDRECRGDDPEDPGFRDLVYRSGFLAGYRAHAAEENESYRAHCEFESEQRSGLFRLMETVDARRRADSAAREPRPGDFPGGLPIPGGV